MKWAKSVRAICCSLVVTALTVPVMAMEAEDAPETVSLDVLQRLYEAVEFDHRLHADGFECASCHHHTTGGGTRQPVCVKCHADSPEAAEVACSACHSAEGPTFGRTGEKQEDRYHIDTPGLLGALHLQCLGCHRTEGAGVGCEDCHRLSPAGVERFSAQR
ncbi:cytochrome c3 family protein [Desulfoprunum benzoelyticum]|uniref:Class III cytochrome C domain-containing protein n=1 Tax=Desulfoprunum benzoelyticum TaxID=1506996 RepID=A0A840V1K9_9BACT|nr:cytochrome c3 family protein [Desulfoprunum benzoelyticum]MBB5347730.1 hypothetical protein [Desulfoprunum benzoelyticum]MBM9529322.1 cytochrome c3 family protein [Desulfoprunum benzoelyticum]